MDAITLAMINAIKGNVNNQLTSVLSGVDSYEVDGLTLNIKLNDGTEIPMEFPKPVDMEDVTLESDSDDKVHLIVTLADGTKYDTGIIPAGLSAYQIAVQNGYEGTEEEWLQTLPGRIEPVRFDFDDPSEAWYVQHNLNNKYIRIQAFDEDGDEIANPVIERYSPNLSIIHFDVPVKGYAVVS